MGGCYSSSYDYSSSRSRSSYEEPKPNWKISVGKSIASFFRDHTLDDLVKAYTTYQENNTSGFIKLLLEKQNCTEAPKEFAEFEYEVKFDSTPLAQKNSKEEPSIAEYLDAFDFPPTKNARLLKDPVNTVSEGKNHFYGKDDEERLVVIEKAGKLFLKEKSQPMTLQTSVPYQEIVIKRTEQRYEATTQQVLQKVGEVSHEGGAYHGYIRKEKGDAFVLDTSDGRIYSFTITRAHLNGNGTIQRQLEIEYAGYIPGFANFTKDNEEQIVTGMIGIAKHVAYFGNNTPLGKGWTMQLHLTNERKYDFVRNKGSSSPVLLPLEQKLSVQLPSKKKKEKTIDAAVTERAKRLELDKP